MKMDKKNLFQVKRIKNRRNVKLPEKNEESQELEKLEVENS